MDAPKEPNKTTWPTVKLGEQLSVEELYQQIQAVKAKLIKSGKLKKEKPLPPISSEEIPFEIPSTWKWVRLGELGELRNGYAFKSEDYVDAGVQVVRISDLGDSFIDSRNAVFYPAKEELNAYYVLEGSILICMTGSIGKMAWVCDKIPRYLNQRVGMFLPIMSQMTKYIWFLLHNSYVIERWMSSKTSTNGNIRSSDITQLPIPLPPLDVQREIVEKVEQGLKEADALAAHFKRLSALADETFKSTLNETFSSLTAPTVKLGDVCEEIRNRISVEMIKKENYITTDNMLKGCGGVRIAESLPPNTSLVEYKCGDILLSNIRPYLKKLWCATFDGGCSSDVIVFRSNRKDLQSNYLYQVLSQEDFFNYVMLNVSGTKMPRGKREWIKEFQFPLPSLEEQMRIVETLEAVKGRCEQLKVEAERGLKAAEALRKAVLAEAFEQ